MEQSYDVIIIGGGPAGLSCAIYAARAKLNTLLIEKHAFGGYTMNIDLIENYPGFSEGISGPELGEKMAEQATVWGANLLFDKVLSVKIQNEGKIIRTSNAPYIAKCLIISSGSKPVKLEVPGEEKFLGHGVSYCAICDAGKFKDKVGIVVGAGDSGITEALYLEKFAEKIFIVEALSRPTASAVLLDRAYKNSKLSVICNTKVVSLEGDSELKGVVVRNLDTGEVSLIDAGGVLVHIGISPNTDFLNGLIPLDDSRRIIVNESMETKIPGIFAAGDVRSGSLCQVGCAVGDGITAALSAKKLYLS